MYRGLSCYVPGGSRGNYITGPNKGLSMRQSLRATGEDLQIPKAPPAFNVHH